VTDQGSPAPPVEPLAVRADPPDVLELPPMHLELAWRPLAQADARAVHALLQATEAVDRSVPRTSPEQVTALLGAEWVDLARDGLVGTDDTGAVRAFALVEVRPGDSRTVRAFLRGAVHPAWRGRGIGRALLTWMEGRGRQKLAASGKDLPARLAVYVDEHRQDQRRLCAAAGFSPVRWYTRMRRDLRAPLPSTRLPEGIRVEPWTPGVDEQVRLAHNEAFVDHWGSEPHSPETWRAGRAHHEPAWSFVAIDGRGQRGDQVAAYLLSDRRAAAETDSSERCAWTELLGVRPAWRGQRLGSALLVQALSAYREDGLRWACLSVDSANPTGAHRLYGRLGYEPTSGEVLYSVEI
jgi:mycothiol synthase